MNELLKVAEEVARQLYASHTDPNEVASCIAFLKDETQAPYFSDYLRAMSDSDNRVVRSKRTTAYYRALLRAYRQHLEPYKDEPQKMAWILGWATRLMRYYRTGAKD